MKKNCVLTILPAKQLFSMLLLFTNKAEFPQDKLGLLLTELHSNTLGKVFHLKSLICMLSDPE